MFFKVAEATPRTAAKEVTLPWLQTEPPLPSE